MRFRADRPMGRIFFGWLILAVAFLAGAEAPAATSKTSIVDVLYRADGTPARGTLLISWPALTTAGGDAIAAGSMTVNLGAEGSVQTALFPNTGSTPQGSYYKVVVDLDDGTRSTEYWVVPQVPQTTIAAVRSLLVPQSQAMQFVGRDYVDSAIASAVGSYVAVELTGNQTIAGVKTFQNPPQVPTPVNPGDAANQQFVLDTVNTSKAAAALAQTVPGTVNATQYEVNGTALASSNLSDAASLAKVSQIPTQTSQLTNNSGFIASAGAPVQSVNGQTGAVSLTIPAAQVNPDWNASSGNAQILNKPTLGTAATHAVTDFDAAGAAASVAAAIPAASSNAPLTNGTAAAGGATTFARADHVHPIDASRQAAMTGVASDGANGMTVAGAVAVGTTLPSGAPAGTIAAQVLFAPAQAINIMAYGAVGDGITNNTAAVQAAANAAANGIMFIPNGVFNIGTINIPANMSIIGASRSNAILHVLPGNAWGLKFNALINMSELANFTLDASAADTTMIGMEFFCGLNATDVHGISFLGPGDANNITTSVGLQVDAFNPQGVANNAQYDADYHSLYFYNWGTGLLLNGGNVSGARANNNIIRSTEFTHNGTHINIVDSAEILVLKNDFNPVVPLVGGTGVRVAMSGHYTNARFEDNYWDNIGTQLAVNVTGFMDQARGPSIIVFNDDAPSTAYVANAGGINYSSRFGQSYAAAYTSPIISTVATGTAPLTVASTTQVNNFNAQYLGGHPVSDFGLLTVPSCSPMDMTVLCYKEEFGVGSGISGNIGELGWTVHNIGAAPSIAPIQGIVPTNIGVTGITSTAVQGQGGELAQDANTIGLVGNLASYASWDSHWIFKLGATTTIRARVGYRTGATNGVVAPTDWVGMRFDTSTGYADTNFQLVSCASSTCTVINTGVPADTNYHDIRVRSLVAGTLLLTFDNGPEQSINTNVSTLSQTPFSSVVTDTTATRSIYLDAWKFAATGLSR